MVAPDSRALVSVSGVAEIETSDGYTIVRLEQLQRYAVLEMDVNGRDVHGFVREAERHLRSDVDS